MNIPYVFKKCNKCGKILPATTEYFRKNKDCKYGLRNDCKECNKKSDKKYREENKDDIKERRKIHDKKYRETHSDEIKIRSKKYYEEHKDPMIEMRKQQYKEQKEMRQQERFKKQQEKEEQARQSEERRKEYRKEYYKQNRDKKLAYSHEYYRNHKAEEREYRKKYRQTPKGEMIMFNSRQKRRAKEKSQDMYITKEQWIECMKFFGFRCAYSGEYIGGKDNQSIRSLDHIESISKGGANEIWNLVPMCKPYNSSKHDRDMLEWYAEQSYFSQERLAKIYEWQEYAFNKWGRENLTEAE